MCPEGACCRAQLDRLMSPLVADVGSPQFAKDRGGIGRGGPFLDRDPQSSTATAKMPLAGSISWWG